MASLLARLEEQRSELMAELDEIEHKAEDAGSYEGLRERADEITKTTLPALNEDILRAKVARERERNAPAIAVEEDSALGAGPITPPTTSANVADQFLSSDLWQNFVKAAGPAGFAHDLRVQSPKVPITGSPVAWLQRRGELNSVGSATVGGELLLPAQSGIVDSFYQRPLTLVDLITRGTTTSSSVDFVRHDYTPAADMVAEATHIKLSDEAGSGVSHKPWSLAEFERVNEPVRTLAVGTPATNAALADMGQLRTIIDGDLRYDLALLLETEIVEGSGSGEHFEGITTVGDTQTQAFSNSVAETLRKAKTKVRIGGRAVPNGILINPEDAEKLDIELLDGGAAYYRAGTITEAASIWGLPLVESEAVDPGDAIVADFRRAVLWDRQQTSIEATSGYMDFFMRNMVAIRAEMRAAFGVIRPAAFVLVSFTS